jgi:hypothetical protein
MFCNRAEMPDRVEHGGCVALKRYEDASL